jgi:hypothetical protein
MSCFLGVNDEESSGKVNIDNLFETKQKRDLKQLSIFNKILNRIHTRIKLTGRSKQTDRHIWFTVPTYIFGEAVYDQGDCIAYLVNNLQDNGFLVKYIHPNTVFVSWVNWVPQYVRSEFKKKTGKLINEKGEISEPQQKDDDKRDGNNNKDANNQKKDGNGKTYTPIDKYKPTGKFVYSPDLLEKIDKKIQF